MYIQLTPEQHEFELCGSTYMWIFFSQYVLQHYVIHCWLNLWIRNCRYIGPTMGLDHPWIFVFKVGPGTNPLWILRNDCIRGDFL